MWPKIQEKLAKSQYWPLRNGQSIRHLWILCAFSSGWKINQWAAKLQKCTRFKRSWWSTGLLCNKWYTGLAANFRKILSCRKPAHWCLTSQQKIRSSKISFDRVLIEKYFGRLCTFILFHSNWRWNKHKYSRFLRFRVALTNAHVIWDPLRRSDRPPFNSIRNRLYFIGVSQSKEMRVRSTRLKGATSSAFIRDVSQ